MPQTEIRGNLADFHITFIGPDGTGLTPPSAKFYIIYTSLGVLKRDVLDLVSTDDGVTWDITIDTAPFDAQTVSWHARCAGDIPAAVEDTLTISANSANPSILGVVPPRAV